MPPLNQRKFPPRIAQKQLNSSGAINKFSETLSRLQMLRRGLSLDQLIILVAVSQTPGVTTNELRRMTGLSAASMSRNTNALSSFTRAGKEGLSLIDFRPDPQEPRRYNFYLTKRGLNVALDIAGVLQRGD